MRTVEILSALVESGALAISPGAAIVLMALGGVSAMSASVSARSETGGTTRFAVSTAALDSSRLDLERVPAAGGAVGGVDMILGDSEANLLDFGQIHTEVLI